MELMTVVILRSFERILAIIIGCLLAYFGYRLFIKAPTKEDSEGKISLPSGAGIHVLRVGPGVFFSLFGAAILVLSFLRPVNYKENMPTLVDTQPVSEGSVIHKDYIGATSEISLDVSKEERQRRRRLYQRDMWILNSLPDRLHPNLDADHRSAITTAIPRIKLAVMETMWDQDWGDFNQFRDWVVKRGAMDAPPEALKEAAAYFNFKP